VSGRFRTRKFYYVAGRKSYLADYRENGCRFGFDVRDVFFSPRLAHERSRVSGLVKDGESVVVMFSGVGPFAIEIAKAHSNCRVVAIELNAKAHSAAIKNRDLNKVGNVVLAQGDVKKLAPKYKGFADRIVMPLPKGASKFLGEVLEVAKPRCTVHYYEFCRSGGEGEAVERIRKFFESHGKRFRLLATREVVPYSRNVVEIVADFTIGDKKI
jgi:tRNA (guanine37-N1)-methyltransferase